MVSHPRQDLQARFKRLSPDVEAKRGLERHCLHRATQRLASYRAGEQLDDFFSALMEDKNANPNGMEWGRV